MGSLFQHGAGGLKGLFLFCATIVSEIPRGFTSSTSRVDDLRRLDRLDLYWLVLMKAKILQVSRQVRMFLHVAQTSRRLPLKNVCPYKTEIRQIFPQG